MASVPDVLDALVALYTNLAVADLQVVDGPCYNNEGSFLAVGWHRKDDTAVTGTITPGNRDVLDFDIPVLLSVWMDDEPLGDVRRRLFNILDTLDAGLLAHRTLGGLVTHCVVTAFDMAAVIPSSGGYLDYQFAVTVQAVRSR